MKKQKIKTGQALVTMLFVMSISIVITTAAVTMVMSNSIATSQLARGTSTFYAAEGGAENALIRLLRNPDYTGENDLPIGNGSADIAVTGTNPKTITSVGTENGFTRTVQVVVSYDTMNRQSITSWKEVP